MTTNAAIRRARQRRTGTAMLLLFGIAFWLLVWAYSSGTSAVLWGLALAAWMIHDVVGYVRRRRGRNEFAATEVLSRLPRET